MSREPTRWNCCDFTVVKEDSTAFLIIIDGAGGEDSFHSKSQEMIWRWERILKAKNI
jgi:hypothetical protein